MGEISLSHELLDVDVLAPEVPKVVCLASFVIEYRTAGVVVDNRRNWRGCCCQCHHEELWERSWSEIETRKEYLLRMTRIRILFDGPDSHHTFSPPSFTEVQNFVSRTYASHEQQVTKFLLLCVHNIVNTPETVCKVTHFMVTYKVGIFKRQYSILE